MNSHVIPIKNMRVPHVLTGYEAIIPIKSDNKFCITAEDNGIVMKVTDNIIEVNYATLGNKVYKFSPWTSKEESGTCYTHKMVVNVKNKQKFLKDDTLVYNSSFFEPCIFSPNRVLYKQGELVNVALTEDIETHEDSASISNKLVNNLSTKVTKVISVVVDVENNIEEYLSVGDKVNSNSTLFIEYTKILNQDSLDVETIKLLKNLNKYSPKAKVNGIINKIDIRYNANRNDMSKSVKKFVDLIDKDVIERTGYTGQVDGSYSIKGKSLLKNKLEIKYYIETEDDMGIGDKAILGNQMKFTVGDIFYNDIKTEDDTNVDLLFSSRSIAARIVSSPYLIGTTSMVLDKLSENIVDMYFNKKE